MKKRIIPILILTTTLLASCGTSNTESTASVEKEQTDISTEVAKDTEQTIETETPTETEIEHNLDNTEDESTNSKNISDMSIYSTDEKGNPTAYKDENGDIYDPDGNLLVGQSSNGEYTYDNDPYIPHATSAAEEEKMYEDDEKAALKAGAYKPNPTYGYKMWIFQREDGTTYVESQVDHSRYEVGDKLPGSDNAVYIGSTKEDDLAYDKAHGITYVGD